MKSTLLFTLAFAALGNASAQTAPDAAELARGRYLVTITGCNDCHTEGYAAAEGKLAQSQWLTGNRLGFWGPWGTTYATNLRLSLQPLSADEWVLYAQNLRTRPIMPWFKLREFTEPDLRALYTFVRSLGDAGAPAPAGLAPGAEPPPPFVRYPSLAARP